MICVQVVNGGSEKQVWTVAGNVLSKQLTRGDPPVWVLTGELTTRHVNK
jgi:hypothetical protein